jgi:hypothetical protein
MSVAKQVLLNDPVPFYAATYDVPLFLPAPCWKAGTAVRNTKNGRAACVTGTTVSVLPSDADADAMLEKILEKVGDGRTETCSINCCGMEVEPHKKYFQALSVNRKDGTAFPKPSAKAILSFCRQELALRGVKLSCFVGNKKILSEWVDGPLPMPFYDLPCLGRSEIYAFAKPEDVGVYVEYEGKRGMAIIQPSNIVRLLFC